MTRSTTREASREQEIRRSVYEAFISQLHVFASTIGTGLEGGQHGRGYAAGAHGGRVDQHPFGHALGADAALGVLDADVAAEPRSLRIADPGAGLHVARVRH